MRRFLLPILLLILAQPSWCFNLWGVEYPGLELGTGLFWVRNTVKDAAPDSVCNTLTIAVPFRLQNGIFFHPEVHFFTINYAYEDSRAIPVETMFDSVTMFSILTNLSAGKEWVITPYFTCFAEGGLGLLFRTPIFFNGSSGSSYAGPVTAWFWSGRFIYPDVGGGFSWQFSPLFALVLKTQLYYPVFNLWNRITWDDETIFGTTIAMRFTF